MKTFIFALLLIAGLASAKDFKVKGKDGKTCAMLTVDGELDLQADKDGQMVSNVKLQFSDATLEDASDCETLKLNLTKSAQVWFKFDTTANNWQVTPIAAFVPEDVFGKDVNETAPVQEMATPLAPFSKDSSYKCKSSQTFEFMAATASPDFNYTVKAVVTGFQIQSAAGDDFKKAAECAADKLPTNYQCKDGNKTMILMDGNFTLVISYNMTNEQGKVVNATQTINVPKPQSCNTAGSVCPAKAGTDETLMINFFTGWSLQFKFGKDKDSFSVSNMSVTYVYDGHLPNHTSTETGPVTVSLPVSSDYLKASTKGYYICNANLDKSKDGVTLTSKNFKYRAFDADSKGFDGDVSECAADESSNSVVPIAVGAALAGLVVIVLIAYLIGRKRSRKTGYESV